MKAYIETIGNTVKVYAETPREVLELAQSGHYTVYLYDDIGGGYYASYSDLQTAIEDTEERAAGAHIAIVHHGKTVYSA